MTHPLWQDQAHRAMNVAGFGSVDPLSLEKHPVLTRVNALYQKENPLSSVLFQHAMDVNYTRQASSGPINAFMQTFGKMPAVNWSEQFDVLVEATVDALSDRLIEQNYGGDLIAWAVGRAYRVEPQGLTSAPLFDDEFAHDKDDLDPDSFTLNDTTAWLSLHQEVLDDVVGAMWSRAAYVAPVDVKPAVGKRGRGRRLNVPTLLGNKGDLTGQMMAASRERLGDDLNEEITLDEDNLFEVRNRLKTGARAAEADRETTTDLLSMAQSLALSRRQTWEHAKHVEQGLEVIAVDPMVDALNRGLFGGDARHQDDYDDEDDVIVDDDEDDGPEGMYDDQDDEDRLGAAAAPQALLDMLNANPGMTHDDLVRALDGAADVDVEEPIPRAHALRRRAPPAKAKLPETMPKNWGMDAWPKEAQRFQLAFESALYDATRRLRGVYVERFVDWLEQKDLGATWSLGQRLWGLRLTQTEFNRLDAVRPMAERLLKESPRLGLFALRTAPLLGINEVDLTLLGDVKRTLRNDGVTDAVWKKAIPALPANWMIDAWGDHLRGDDTRVARCALNLLSWKDKGHLLEHDMTVMASLLKDPDSPYFETLINALEYPKTHVGPSAEDDENLDPDDDAEEDQYSHLDAQAKEALRSQTLAAGQSLEQAARRERLPSLVKAIVARLDETSAVNFFTNEWPLVNDYLERSEMGTWQTFPSKMTWPMLWRRQQAWHEMLLQAEKGKHYRYQWESALPIFTQGDFKALPLENGGDLWEEGKVMHHCVSSYASDCKKGRARIFSIRKGDQRVGTLELTRHRSGGWALGQFMAYCNQTVTVPGAQAFTKLVRAAYIRAEIEGMLKVENSETVASTVAAPSVPLALPMDVNDDATGDEAATWLREFKAKLPKPPEPPEAPTPAPRPHRPR